MITVTIIGHGNPPSYKCKEILRAEVELVSFRTLDGFIYDYFGLPYVITHYPDNQIKLFQGER